MLCVFWCIMLICEFPCGKHVGIHVSREFMHNVFMQACYFVGWLTCLILSVGRVLRMWHAENLMLVSWLVCVSFCVVCLCLGVIFWCLTFFSVIEGWTQSCDTQGLFNLNTFNWSQWLMTTVLNRSHLSCTHVSVSPLCRATKISYFLSKKHIQWQSPVSVFSPRPCRI